ncbi:hypothetical protein QYF36_018628 [Acer negundo]|nr:hypothetical protein QYF36_018628 [Acer negundo]
MVYGNSISARIQDHVEVAKLSATAINGDIGVIKLKYKIDGKAGKSSLKAKVLSRVFSEGYERVKKKILDPRGPTIRRWSKIFLVTCPVSLFVDPLFFYLPVVRNQVCTDIGIPLEVILTIIRSLSDAFYIIQIYIRFRTAYVAPSTRVFGRDELVIDSSKISLRYFRKGFWIDLIAALPLPQYLPRLFLIFPLSSQIVEASGIVTETAWAGAAYNLILFMLASHVIGACWYLLSIERQEACWRSVCNDKMPSCQYGFFDCHTVEETTRDSWFKSSNITSFCNPDSSFYRFGIYSNALTLDVTTASFFNKCFYCLCSSGQNLATSTYVGEILFAIIIATLGLVLFALLIGNMQTYLQSTTVRLEEWRIKRTDTEQWMHHRQLPSDLRQFVRKYDQYKWAATGGVDEESLLEGLPMDLRRDIK